jgi:YjbE family integral membrane protein
MNWEFASGLLQIIFINITLSGDNAIVIGMAAASLPRNQRTGAIVFGGLFAIVLRIVLTLIATWLLDLPLVSAVGGLVLFWVAWKFLKMDASSEEEEASSHHKTANTFKQAIFIILVADLVMSLDNVLAVAGAAHGNYLLLILGLIISMPLLMATGGLISRLIDKFRWIPFLGAAIICYVGMDMIFTDKFLEKYIELPHLAVILIAIAFGLIFPTIIFLINKRKAAKNNAGSKE